MTNTSTSAPAGLEMNFWLPAGGVSGSPCALRDDSDLDQRPASIRNLTRFNYRKGVRERTFSRIRARRDRAMRSGTWTGIGNSD